MIIPSTADKPLPANPAPTIITESLPPYTEFAEDLFGTDAGPSHRRNSQLGALVSREPQLPPTPTSPTRHRPIVTNQHRPSVVSAAPACRPRNASTPAQNREPTAGPSNPNFLRRPPQPLPSSRSAGNLRSKSEPMTAMLRPPMADMRRSLHAPPITTRPPMPVQSFCAPGPISPTQPPSGVHAEGAKPAQAQKSTYEFPLCFSRPPQSQLAYSAFSPMYLLANRMYLNSGFPPLPPPTAQQPHPFSSHDVSQSDWTRFLSEIQQIAALSTGQKFTAAVVPMVLTLGVTGLAASNAMKGSMKRRKQRPVADLINLWNHHFFRPRGMEIMLARGREQLTGVAKCPTPDLTHERERLDDLRVHSEPSLPQRQVSSRALVLYDKKGKPREPNRSERKAQRKVEKMELKIRLREEKEEKRRLRKQWNRDRKYRLWVVGLS